MESSVSATTEDEVSSCSKGAVESLSFLRRRFFLNCEAGQEVQGAHDVYVFIFV